MIKAVFFDMGGVICVEGFRGGIKKYEEEKNIPTGEFYKVVHDHQGWKDFTLGLISEQEYLRQCAARAGGLPFDGQRYVDLIDELTIPNTDMIQYIKDLARTTPVGIVSNHPREWFEKFSQKVGLDNVWRWKVVSGFVHLRKPGKEIFLRALELADAQPNEAVYVDDRADILDGIIGLDGLNLVQFDGDMEKFKNKMNSFINP